MDKPIQIRIEEAKQEIVDSINNIINEKQLDYYFLHSIMKDIYNEISTNKDAEIAQLQMQQYEENQEEQEVKENEKLPKLKK